MEWKVSSLKRRVHFLLVSCGVLFSLNSFVYGHWIPVTPLSVSASWRLNGVHFTSQSEGWAVGEDSTNARGILLHYSNGAWENAIPPPVSADWGLNSVHFTSPSEGWAVGKDSTNARGILLHYSNETWTNVIPPDVSANWNLSGVHFTSANEGWAVGVSDGPSDPSFPTLLTHRGVLLHYANGAWTDVPPPPVSTSSGLSMYWSLAAVHFTSADEGWAVGTVSEPPWMGFLARDEGLLLHYSNGSWTDVTSQQAQQVSSSGMSEGYVATKSRYTGVHFTSANEGWIVGSSWHLYSVGSMDHYSNGIWANVILPSVSADWGLNSVDFTSPNEGWAAGLDYVNGRGVLLRYSSGTWANVILPPVSADWGLNSVHFTTPNEGWAVGGDVTNKTGVLLRYSYPSDVLAFVIGYYLDVLDRAPEPGGAEWWVAEIERIADLGIDIKEGFQGLAKFFFDSEEYGLKGKDDVAFVTDLYQTFLNRAPDSDGLNFWLNYLGQGLTRDMLITQFAYSEEFNLYMANLFGSGMTRPENNLVNDLYRGFLNRFPDTAGFNMWLGMMRNAQCMGGQSVKDLTQQIALGFVQSAEYGLRNRNNQEYVEDLYNGILRRGADPGGFSYWVDYLSSGTYNREQLLPIFTDSAEFQLRVNDVINAGCMP